MSESIERTNLLAADLIVTVSQPMKFELVHRGISSGKILVNPNGVDAERYHPEIDGTPIRDELKLGSSTVIGFIGTFGRWHGAEILAEAFGRLLKEDSVNMPVKLLMIGDGITTGRVRDIIEREGAGSEVIFTGMVDQAKGPAYLAACDILVSPHVPNPDGTPFFGSPTKLFEYMAMGKGIVASNLDQIGEFLKHGETAWLVQPGDPHDLAAGLRTLIENPVLRKKIGKNARKDVLDRYTWRCHTERIIENLI
jgi:glycosyltransferase involved in cell wall biosynthesis